MSEQPVDLKSLARADGRGLKKRLLKGFSSQLLTFGTLIASRFLLVPLYIGAWGIDLYADWLVLLSMSWLLQSAILGQHWRYAKEIRDAWAIRDVAGMNRLIADANGFWVLLFGGVALVILMIALLVDLRGILHLGAMSQLEANLVLLLLTWTSLATSSHQTFRSVYQARGDFARSELIVTRRLALQTALIAVLLLLGANVVTIAAVQCVSFLVVTTAVLVTDSQRHYPEVRHRISLHWRALPSRTDLRDFGLPHVAETVSIGGPMFILGSVDTPSQQIVQFGLARTIGQTLRMLTKPLTTMFTVELVRQYKQDDRRRMKRLYLFSVIAMAVLVGGLTGGLIGGVDLLYEFWTRGAITADKIIFGLVLGYASVISLGWLYVNLLRLGGFARDLVGYALASAAGYATIATTAAIFFGAYGLGVAILSLEVLFGFLLPAWLLNRRMDFRVGLSIGLGLAIAVVTGVAAYGSVVFVRSFFGL